MLEILLWSGGQVLIFPILSTFGYHWFEMLLKPLSGNSCNLQLGTCTYWSVVWSLVELIGLSWVAWGNLHMLFQEACRVPSYSWRQLINQHIHSFCFLSAPSVKLNIFGNSSFSSKVTSFSENEGLLGSATCNTEGGHRRKKHPTCPNKSDSRYNSKNGFLKQGSWINS